MSILSLYLPTAGGLGNTASTTQIVLQQPVKMAPNSAPQPDTQAMTTLFGIKNCDTIKKARYWLAEHDIAYQFHDYRSDGLVAGPSLAPF